MPLYPSGRTTDSQKTDMLDNIYLATLGLVRKYTGSRSHLVATSLREIATEYTPAAHTLRAYNANTELGAGAEDRALFGFGFKFARFERSLDLDLARVCVIDFGTWTLRHLFHFQCK